MDVALDEKYEYSDGYLIVDNFESKVTGEEYFMRKTESSTATALVAINPAVTSEKSLQIRPGNYDEFFTLKFRLPEGRTLKNDFTHFEFDIFYDITGDNQKQDLKVHFDAIQSTPFFKTGTGEKTNHGKWEHISVPLNGVLCGNTFKLYIGVRTRSANYYVDNMKLKMNYSPQTPVITTPETKLEFYCLNEILHLNTVVERLSVYSLSGKLELTEKNTSLINIAGLSSGMYIMQVQISGKDYTMKFTKYF